MKSSLNRMINILGNIFLVSLSSMVISRANALTNDTSGKFHVLLEPYIMFASMSGTTGIGNLPNTFVCVPASEVFSHLKIGGMLYAEVHNDKFAFTSDLFYASLSQDASTKNGVLSGTANLKQFWWEIEGLYRLTSWWEVGLGARINAIQANLNINVTLPGGGSRDNNDTKRNIWVDPLIVSRFKTWIDNKWLLCLRADIGGFGIGSEFAWQLQPDIAYRISKLFQVGIGYRLISMKYNKGSGSDRFLFDMEEYGPQVRIGFNF
jgi:hypothetical protein